MSDVIRVLPDSVANQIAAGEVIQRPSAVIKELVENAIDAGATEVRVFIRDAGRTLIQVVDNGRGMTETDARMAFERHATSKIRSADDLFTLRTMGFRGEALPSICAISQVEVKTRTADDQVGTRLVINASRVETQEPCMCDKGTSMSVKNIFFNIPVRRKFLKSDSVELANIMREFERMALVNNNVRMSIDSGGRTLDLMPGNFKQRIGDIWKNNLNLQLLPVDVETSIVRISGFVSRPEFARRRNPLQYLIVNGRVMRHPYFHKAILTCFDNLIPSDTQPCYFLKFEVDPASIDVNISPTKNEIKFENEKEIWPILTASVRAALGKFSAVPSIDFNADILRVAPLPDSQTPDAPGIDMPAGYNPFDLPAAAGPFPGQTDSDRSRHRVSAQWRPTRADSNWDALYDGFLGRPSSPSSPATPDISDSSGFPDNSDSAGSSDSSGLPSALCLQIADSYIATATREGLVIIDQHRAHVRILFEEYMRRPHDEPAPSQRVMFPETIELDTPHILALEDVEEELKHLGFILRPEVAKESERDEAAVVTGRWRIEGMPANLGKTSPADVIMRILDSVCDDSATYGTEADPASTMRRNVALVLARSAAIHRGTHLTAAEMESMVSRLFQLPDPALTPSGRPVFRLVSHESLASLF